ncbi:ABC transporter permease [Bdellovibrio sp. 22V]|uniref:ABC transporter permease n=1 Tax=Bdellovibrio TaxID=958 RepID=UPI002543513E|nr:ABC transporter permease [Bdellovibrio sp. 22V]WII71141.1 ABC transporter permease [Bdellovibrio sp. 22V]
MSGFVTIFQREIARFLKVIVQTVVTPFVSSFLYLLIFGVSLGEQMASHQGVSYLAFLIPGLMMMGLINNAFQNSSSSIVSSKFSGDLEDLRVAPITDQEIIWAMSLGAVVRGSLVALITYIVGSAFLWYQQGQWLTVAHPLLTLFFLLVAGLIFGMIGISIAFWATTFDQLSAFSAFILLPLTYLGGVFLSIEHLHPFWQMVSKFNPLLYLINGLRYGILGVSDVNVWTAATISVVGFLFFYVVARWSLKKGSFQRW